MEIDNEVYCQEIFDQYLRSKLNVTAAQWERVPKGEDPPDFYLTVNDTCFAVEVTTTEVMCDVSVGTGQVREMTFRATHRKLVQAVEEVARKAGVLRGAYGVVFMSPLAASSFSVARRELLRALLDYIRSTQWAEDSRSQTVLVENRPVCRIMKFHAKTDKVYDIFQNFTWVEAPEVAQMACQLLREAVNDKRARFERRAESLPLLLQMPKILLLLSSYHFADAAMYINCVSSIQSITFFHSVFVVQGDGQGALVHTHDVCWSRAITSA